MVPGSGWACTWIACSGTSWLRSGFRCTSSYSGDRPWWEFRDDTDCMAVDRIAGRARDLVPGDVDRLRAGWLGVSFPMDPGHARDLDSGHALDRSVWVRRLESVAHGGPSGRGGTRRHRGSASHTRLA